MPRIVFARLKVKEQKKITAGITVITGTVGANGASSAAPCTDGPHCMAPMTIKMECILDPEWVINFPAIPAGGLT